jgi:Cu(I)/Ag(I) efflux system periplasmic protein CusF
MKRLFAAVFLGSSLVWAPVFADSDHGKKGHGAHGASAQAADMADGEIRKVDKDAKKITIKHGPLAKLDMPAMTMVFQVKDPAMLDKVKAGDKVKFQAEKVGGAFTLVKLEPVH